MIIEISIENYLSIKDKVTISMESSASKKLLQNLLEPNKLLKTAVIYGANASGKSNLIKGVFFIYNLVKNSHMFNIDMKIPLRLPFKLDEDSLNKPSRFEILFIYKDINYKYGFSCNDDKIIDEYLFYWPKGRESQIFNRTKTKEFDFTIDKKQQDLIKSQMNDNVLYLSRATQLGYDKTKEAYEFIVKNVAINYGPSWADFTIKKLHEDPKLKDKIIDILKKADFGGISDLEVIKKKGKVQGFEFKIDKGETTFVPIKEKEEDIYDIQFQHKIKNGKPAYFSMSEESNGTEKTLSMLGPIFDILESGKTAFIDELELNLHREITKLIVKLFYSKMNKGAQLIFTTHDTSLLSNEIFRRDQIYICSKEPNSNTLVKSYLDYDLRETSDFEKAYINGRVGGIPFIDESILE
ncbi:MAG: ATP-binding protein [Nanoarchaeota archaeon]|nr:ATP-binding protein [Nanoarchaeota archaeon]